MRDNETTMLETFSDSVFAIAITLLVLEIRAPHVGEGESFRVLWSSCGPRTLGTV